MEGDFEQRYAAYGGLAALAKAYEQEGISLSEVGRTVGVSGQTVRNDLSRFLGRAPQKAELFRERRPPKGYGAPRPFAQAQALRPAVEGFVVSAFEDFRAETIEPWRPPNAILLRDGSRALVRIVEEREGDRFTRVRVRPGTADYDTVYVIVHGQEAARCFRFRGRDICAMQTLALSNNPKESRTRYGGALLR